jgi:hypothetical protein
MVIRKTTAALLLFFMLFCITKNTALLSLYQFNQSLFVSLLCENKSRPTLKCNGKCQLSRIAKEQQQDRAAQVLNSLQSDIFFFYESPTIHYPSFQLYSLKKVYNQAKNAIYQNPNLARINKPPTVLS